MAVIRKGQWRRAVSRRRRYRGGGLPWGGLLAVVLVVVAGTWVAQRPVVLREETVVDVLDGDSLVLQRGGERLQIRLYGVDCPERGQPYSARAREFTRSVALNRRVTVAIRDEDPYGRLVSEVTLPDGRVLNQLLVGEGWAWWYRHHAEGDRVLARLEEEARVAGRGLWADRDPTPPWDYRAARRAE